MKILTISYTWDFARFMHKLLEESFQSANRVSLALYPSAHSYFKGVNENSIFLPNQVKKIPFIKEDAKNYANIITEAITFNAKVFEFYGRNKENQLKKLAYKYIIYFENILIKNQFDLILCAGDSRLSIEILKVVAKKYSIPIKYFEQGPYRTTILDDQGVNANVSFGKETTFKQHNKVWLDGFFERADEREKNTIWQNPIPVSKYVRVLDLLYMFPPRFLSRLLPLDTQLGETLLEYAKAKINIRRNHSKNQGRKINYDYSKTHVLLALQVPVDAQFLLHSPLYNSFLDIVLDVINALPDDCFLTVREHPFYQGRYGKELYDAINGVKNCIINNTESLDESLDRSELIILNNSTVALDAYRKHKKVLFLGDAYYKQSQISFEIQAREELPNVVSMAIGANLNTDKIDDYLYTLLCDYLYEVHFQDQELSGNLL